MATVRIVGGKTSHTGWSPSHGASRTVDTSSWSFSDIPLYFCSMRGLKDMWLTSGVSNIYDSGGGWGRGGKNGFTIYVGYDEFKYAVHDATCAQNSENQWSVEWIGVEGPPTKTWVIDTSEIKYPNEEKIAEPEVKPEIKPEIEMNPEPVKIEPESIPEGDIELESGVNNTLVADVNWAKKLIQWKRDKSRPTQRWKLNRNSDGLYHIRHSDGNALAASGEWDLSIEPLVSDNTAQLWSVKPVTVYRIVNRNDSEARAVSATHETTPGYPRVILFEDQNQTNQQWLLIPSPPEQESTSIPTGNINVQNVGVYRERVLTAGGDGNIVHATKDETNPAHWWQLTPATGADGFYHIKHNDDKVLAFGRWDLGVESLDTDKSNQQWSVTPTTVYRIVNQLTGLDLSINTEQPYDGEAIVQYKYERRPNQHWKLKKVS